MEVARMRFAHLKGLRFLYVPLALLLASALMVLLPGSGSPAVGWAPAFTGGMGDPNNIDVRCMATYNSRLYVGLENWATGCEVWSTDGTTWVDVTMAVGHGFGDTNNTSAVSMAVFDSRLFVGTWNGNGCEVWSFDGASWQQSVGQGLPGTPTGPGFGNSNNTGCESLLSWNSQLFAGTQNPTSGCEVWVTGGIIWTPLVSSYPGAVIGPGFGDLNNTIALSLAGFGGELYTGVSNYATSCEVWKCNPLSCTQMVGNLPGTPTPSGFGYAGNVEVLSMALFRGKLFAGTNNFSSGCEVWSTETGAAWSREVGSGPYGSPNGPGFGYANNTLAYSMLVYDSRLFVGTYNSGGCQIWGSDDGAIWEMNVGTGLSGDYAPGFGNANNQIASCLGMLNNRFYAGAYNISTGCEVRFDRFSTTWYLAEGATAGGYETWVLVQNPGTVPVDVLLVYQTGSGEVIGPSAVIPAASRSSFLVNTTVETFDVSTLVLASGNVVCERAVYWTPPGYPTKVVGTDSIGVTNPTATWYLAEGATAGGYETWVLVQNPNDSDVYVNIGYYTESGYVMGPLGNIPARSRGSYKVNDTVESFNVSTTVWATDNVICERAVYWTPSGTSYKTLGTDCIGVNDVSKNWYLAEGATAGGYETWILVQNPGLGDADIDIRFQTESGEVHGPVDTVPAGTRRSYRVNDTVETFDVSTAVYASEGVVCERSMYYTPPGYANKTVGHDSVGVTASWNEWYLAEGATAGGYETWVLVQNPMPYAVDVQLIYQTGSGPMPGPTASIPAESRHSFLVNDTVETYDVSTKVVVVGPGYVICERAVYWTPPGSGAKALGTESIGWPDL
jgi:hypothetical protein